MRYQRPVRARFAPPELTLVLALLLAPASLSLLAGCPDTKVAVDASVRDAMPGEAIDPPDLGRPDGFTGLVGKKCDPAGPNICSGDSLCFNVGRNIGVCAIPDCTLEDPATSQREDNCPTGTACGQVSVSGDAGYKRRTFCFAMCTPQVDANPCAAIHPDLSCDPSTILLTGYTEVCAAPGCHQDTQCGTGQPLDPKAVCDTKTNICFSDGKKDATVGDPCWVSQDCGKDQFCYPELAGAGKPKVLGGYCTKLGCKYEGRWSCPSNSKCFQLGAGQAVSICLATGCDTKADPLSDGCRDEAPAGAYDCFKIGDDAVCWIQQN